MTDDDKPPVIGYVFESDVATHYMVCANCSDSYRDRDDMEEVSNVRDQPVLGNDVPYPECAVCQSVIRP